MTVFRVAGLAIGMAIIFAADTLTDYEIAAAVFYVAVVLVAADLLPRRGVLAVAAICAALTIVSLPMSHAGLHQSGVINVVLSISAIAVTTWLALQRTSALVAEHEARAQLTRLARVNALGEMAASIAHEVNQPLTGIVASGAACRNWLTGNPPNIAKARQAAERMISDANRASGMVTRVRNLSRRAEPKVEWIDANGLVADVLALCRSELVRADVAVARKTTERPLRVLADEVQLQQVLLNLILNALEAMNGAEAYTRELTVETELLPDAMVRFTVTDTGRGIDPEWTDHIFDALYTTKAEGTGMGLAISRSIVEAHGGRIWAAPHPGRGAEFYFILPGKLSGGT
ncbi:MAG: two-component sensor histidine kinase [Stutzerimonas stutzeri]|nr:MAG: two-component sensor histidine kinase [Stutzerimonas stutzeri]